MLGLSNSSPQIQQQQQQSRRTGIVITRPTDNNTQNFRTARNVETNVAVQGPQVEDILSSILKMDEAQREVLSEGLSKAGF